MTTVTLKVLPTEDTACGRCVFTAFTNVGGKLKRLTSKYYPRETLTWRVPTSATRNMSFAVTKGDMALGDATGYEQTTSGLVMQFKGVPVGTRLTPAQARTQTSGSWCWVGTKSRSITLGVTTLKSYYGNLPSPNPDDLWWDSVIPYTNPMAGANDNYISAGRGEMQLGNDGPDGKRPPKPVCK